MNRAVLLLAALVGVAAAQPRFRSDLDVVNVTVTVTDRSGRFVSGLQKSDFVVLEDGRPKDVAFFAGESTPVSLGILLDASGSMTGTKLGLARQVVSRLVTDDLDATTEWLFARFTAAVVVAQDWTADRDAIVQPLRETRATGDTSLYDAVALAIPLAGRIQPEEISACCVGRRRNQEPVLAARCAAGNRKERRARRATQRRYDGREKRTASLHRGRGPRTAARGFCASWVCRGLTE